MRQFTAENRAAVLARLELGATLTDAIHAAGLKEPTVKTWLQRGRKESDTDYAEFAEAVDATRADAEPMTREEYDQCLEKAIRGGSVQAMKLWWEISLRESDDQPEEPGDSFESLDEVAEARSRRAA